MGLLGQLVHLALLVTRAKQVKGVALEILDHLDQVVNLVLADQVVKRAVKEAVGQLVQLDPLVQKEIKVKPGQQGLRAHQVNLEMLVL